MPGGTLVSTRRTPWVRGPSAVIDAMVLGGVSTDNQVYFERVIPHSTFTRAHADAVVAAIGSTIDTVINDGHALGASFAQDTDQAGLLHNFMRFTVGIVAGSTGGLITTTVELDMQHVVDGGVAYVDAQLAQARGTLG